MRTAARFFISLAIGAALATSFLPVAPAAAVEPAETSCCAMMKLNTSPDGCAHEQAPASDTSVCCSVCPFCVAVLPGGARPFVYAASGDHRFPAFAASAHMRAHKPLVPPPRVPPV